MLKSLPQTSQRWQADNGNGKSNRLDPPLPPGPTTTSRSPLCTFDADDDAGDVPLPILDAVTDADTPLVIDGERDLRR